ncbi:hypothetical protein GGX14DRAFT_632441 [Mycena pura]|uniref:Uncharacterized protein n=1 Tax=Mycena pura TaxID=153505 RepID=A0AAD6VCV4_9AGAR|nr:hypothetical protein GGX14DRAFT_632441 [Mycena pura]
MALRRPIVLDVAESPAMRHGAATVHLCTLPLIAARWDPIVALSPGAPPASSAFWEEALTILSMWFLLASPGYDLSVEATASHYLLSAPHPTRLDDEICLQRWARHRSRLQTARDKTTHSLEAGSHTVFLSSGRRLPADTRIGEHYDPAQGSRVVQLRGRPLRACVLAAGDKVNLLRFYSGASSTIRPSFSRRRDPLCRLGLDHTSPNICVLRKVIRLVWALGVLETIVLDVRPAPLSAFSRHRPLLRFFLDVSIAHIGWAFATQVDWITTLATKILFSGTKRGRTMATTSRVFSPSLPAPRLCFGRFAFAIVIASAFAIVIASADFTHVDIANFVYSEGTRVHTVWSPMA